MTAQPMIEARGVSKDFLLPHLRQRTIKGHFVHMFGRRRTIEVQHALSDITFDVAPGEFFGIVGRNGSGKSTLLKILAGIYSPTSGHVSVQGRLVPFIELGVGFNAELTGRENVYLNAALLGFSKAEVDEMYDDIVTFAELEDSMDQKLKNYSSGMQVRIAFSVATRAKADVLLVDEVLAVGDTAFQRKCFDHFHALKRKGTTIVFVTHNMSAVREFCDRAILIEDTRLVAEGTAEHMATRYEKLFSHAAPQVSTVACELTQDKRWGEGDVRYTAVEVPEVLNEGEALVLDLQAAAGEDVAEPVFTFVIRDARGTMVMGTNSQLKKTSCGTLKKDDRVSVRWSVPNVFSDGLHSLELGIVDRQGLTVYDSWQEAASFLVTKDEKTPYVVTPGTSLTLRRIDGEQASGLAATR